MNIYVSNLSWDTTSEGLQELFSQYGQVSSASVITDRETGRSRGFGFVEMDNDTEGQAAIDALNQFKFEGNVINVNVARPKAPRSFGGGNRGGGFGGNRGGGFGGNRGGGFGGGRDGERRGFGGRRDDNRGGGYGSRRDDSRGGFGGRRDNDRGGYGRSEERGGYNRNDRY